MRVHKKYTLRYTRASWVTHRGGAQLAPPTMLQVSFHLLLVLQSFIAQQSADSGGNQNVNVDKADIMA